MGCTASKLGNEDSVRRCKERRRLMKDAVYARHHLAAAHSDYCRSLKVTGSALTTFAAGEPLSVADQTPAVLLPTRPSPIKPPSFHPYQTPPPPPPQPVPSPAPAPFSRSASVAESKLPPIHAAAPRRTASVNHSQRHQNPKPKPKPKPKPTIKLPHILSESSEASYSPREIPHHNYNYNPDHYTYNAQANYASTPSQASSVWNWENFYPPSPPDSEYFNRRKPNFDSEDDKSSVYSGKASNYSNHNNNTNREVNEDKRSVYSIKNHQIQYPVSQTHQLPQKQQVEVEDDDDDDTDDDYNSHHLKSEDDEEERDEREEVQCSEWDHYSTTSSTSDDEEIDRDSRSEMESRSNFGSSVHNDNESVARPFSVSNSVPKSKFDKMSKSERSFKAESSSESWKTGQHDDNSDMRMVIRHRDLTEIVASIKEYFDKAADAGEQVSEMLETGRAQLDRSFRQLKKTVYHSSGMLSNLSSSWTSKPPLAVKYRFEPGSIGEPGGSKSLCSTLERLLAWEMKLYQEVKAREGVKLEHEKKLSALQRQEYKGEDESKLNKTKASIKKLQSLILVTSQAASTTSTAIVGLRDSELVPQLIELCHGFMYMWRSMNQCHEVQNQIVQQVRGLVNQSTKGESTSDLHRQATRELEAAVSAWHTSFCRLIKFQRDLIRSLHGWFKLSLLPTNTEEASINVSQSSDVYLVFDEWKLALDRLPDTVASEAIKSFINVVHSISLKQAEERKVKKRTESASKELEKKMSSLRSIEKKYYHSYSMVGLGLPGSEQDNGHGLDARDPLSEKKAELMACQRRVEDEMVRHSKSVEVTRAMTLNNIQTGLPGVFQAMTSFSGLIMEALEVVCNKSYAIK